MISELDTKLPPEVREIIQFEPLLKELLALDEEEARILALMFYNGGYSTKDAFFRPLRITRPTLIKKINRLIELGIIRQNEEFVPIRLTLTLDIEHLNGYFKAKRERNQYADAFLRETINISPKRFIRTDFKRAIQRLLPSSKNTDLVAEILTMLYIDQEEDQLISFSV
ncbi:MAG: hypothetical protein ACFFBD_18680, partial [Candidatus Hodarchaeota archaeon]